MPLSAVHLCCSGVNASKVATASIILDEAKSSSSITCIDTIVQYRTGHAYEARSLCMIDSSGHSPPMFKLVEAED